MTDVPAPNRLIAGRPGLYLLTAVASVLLSLWALYLDPVINSDGVSEVRAAQLFGAGEWRAGLETAGVPLYALLGAALDRLTGLGAAHSLHALNAGFFALLCAGFVVLVSVMTAPSQSRSRHQRGGPDGGWYAPLLAAGLALLFPALNGLRADIAGDAGFWAFYVWSLAWFLHYAEARDRRSLAACALTGLTALLFGLQALAFLLLVPLWLSVRGRAGAGWRTLRILAIVAGGAVLLGYALWQMQWRDGLPAGALLHPLDQFAGAWQALSRALDFKREALREEFLDQYSQSYDDIALLATVLVLAAAGLIKSLGLAYAAVTGYALAGARRAIAPGPRHGWGVFAVVSMAVLLVPAMTGFKVAKSDAVPAGLTLLAIAPPALERLWRNGARQGLGRWLAPLLLVLVAAAGIHGLDLRSQQLHLREAGLWLRASAPPDTTLYSNSRIVAYYAGLDGPQPPEHAWQAAMATVRGDQWRDYRYLALAISAGHAHREGILMRQIDIQPVRTFAGDHGGRVLIFDTRR